MSTLIFKALVRIKDSAPIFSAFTSSPAKNAALRAPEKRSDKVMAKQTKTFIFIFHLRLKSGSARDRHQTFAGIGGLLIANLNERQSSRVTRRCFLTWDMGSSFNF
jgi:hypothetical protein